MKSLIDRRGSIDYRHFFLAWRLIRPSCAPIRSAHECIVNRRGIRRRIIREEAFRSRESHRKHPRRRGPSSISSLRLSMTSRRRKYHAVREVQSCGPDVWSRSQSFPDSQKFSITSLFDNTLLSEFSTIDRSTRIGKKRSRLVTALLLWSNGTAWTIRKISRVRETSREKWVVALSPT